MIFVLLPLESRYELVVDIPERYKDVSDYILFAIAQSRPWLPPEP
jgi:hypothetical protein